MSRKTERLYASVALDGTTKDHAIASFSNALDKLESQAEAEDREVLYDTLNVGVDRSSTEERTFVGDVLRTTTWSVLDVGAEAVKR